MAKLKDKIIKDYEKGKINNPLGKNCYPKTTRQLHSSGTGTMISTVYPNGHVDWVWEPTVDYKLVLKDS